MTFSGANVVETVPLSLVSPYVTCRIRRLTSVDQARRRLLHIGFVPGAQATPIRRSPAGDPTAYLVRGAVIALRKEQADEIMVTPEFPKFRNFESSSGSDANIQMRPHPFCSPANQWKTRLTCALPIVMKLKSKPTPKYTIALAGNPNTGKSALFNALTGLNQHTGNWPGKTVAVAEGFLIHKGTTFRLIDLPGTYSLVASSKEEEVARDFICFGKPDVTVVVTDATCLERNLNLVLEILEVTSRVVVALNLIDEAYRKRISINVPGLSSSLGAPVIPTVARLGHGLRKLMDTVEAVADARIVPDPSEPTYDANIEETVSLLEPWIERAIQGTSCSLPARWIALRLLDGDQELIKELIGRLRNVASEGGMSA